MNQFRKIWCWWAGHNWSQVYGYHSYPGFGALCYRCGKQAQTLAEFEAMKVSILEEAEKR